MIDCVIADNSAGDAGGGASCNANSFLTMTGCTISENYATNHGAGVISWDRSSVILSNCTITKNSSGYEEGAGFCGQSSSMTITNCSITENSGATECGAIFCWQNGNATITNSIIWANTAPQGIQLRIRNGGTITISYSDVAGGKEAAIVDNYGVFQWGMGNIDADPLFARLGYLDDKSTRDPSDDVWVEDDFHLRSQAGRWDSESQVWVQDDITSPCIDAGDPTSPIGWESFPNGGFVNMGAYGGTLKASKSYFGEPVCETIVAGDINGDGQVNRTDLEIMALHWTDEEPLPLP
jgi:hypothetical protein